MKKRELLERIERQEKQIMQLLERMNVLNGLIEKATGPRFVDCFGEKILDILSNLQWRVVVQNTRITQQEACEMVAKLGEGWRMPTRGELQSLYECGKNAWNIDEMFVGKINESWEEMPCAIVVWTDIVRVDSYICVDSTDEAAIWSHVPVEASMGIESPRTPTVDDGDSDGYQVGSVWTTKIAGFFSYANGEEGTCGFVFPRANYVFAVYDDSKESVSRVNA